MTTRKGQGEDPEPMNKADRDALIKIVRARAKQVEREADIRQKILLAEVQNLVSAEYSARDALWADAVTITEDFARKANDQIRAQCADLGIPPQHAPELTMGFRRRSSEFSDSQRRAELTKLAEPKLAALTSMAKTQIQGAALDAEEKLVLGGLESSEARQILALMPTVEQLMPLLGLDDLGVKGWQPAEDAASQLTTPMTPADRKRRRVLRAIENNPGQERPRDRGDRWLRPEDGRLPPARSRWGIPRDLRRR
jgi:hypothetical protein